MTYKHIAVESLVDVTKREFDVTRETHPYWVDGWPVVQGLCEFAKALRQVNPSVKFGAHNPRFYQSIEDHLFVYVDSCDYTLGFINYDRNHIDSKDGKYTYGVYARGITNGKMRLERDMYNMLVTTDLTRAVKNAAKSLIPYSIPEIAKLSIGDFSFALRDVKNTATNNARKFVSKCASFSVLEIELKNLIRSGAEFVTPEFREAAAEFIASDTEAQELKGRKMGGYFVSLREERGVMTAHTVMFNSDIAMNSRSSQHEVPVTIPASDLPDDVQGKLAVLSMVDADTLIPDVGMKVSNNMFWIARDVT